METQGLATTRLHLTQHIANDLREKRGMDTSRAIATAVAIVKNPPENWGVEARAAAAKAAAEWEAIKARAGSKKLTHARWVEHNGNRKLLIESDPPTLR